MPKTNLHALPEAEMQEGKDIFDIVSGLDDVSKMMVLVYAGALRDKQMLDQQAS